MKTNYTPGPWAVDAVGVNGEIYIDAPLLYDPICIVRKIDEDGETTAMGNAFLICAAPFLYEQLEYLLDCIETGREPGLGNAWAAIRKARGTS